MRYSKGEKKWINLIKDQVWTDVFEAEREVQ